MKTKSTLPVLQAGKWIAIWSTVVIALTVAAFAQGQAPPARAGFAVLHCEEVADSKVRLRIILVAGRPEAEMVLEKLKGGQSFADLAKQYSIDDATKADGGLVGLISVGDLRKEFQTALNGIRAGDTTGIITLQISHSKPVEETCYANVMIEPGVVATRIVPCPKSAGTVAQAQTTNSQSTQSSKPAPTIAKAPASGANRVAGQSHSGVGDDLIKAAGKGDLARVKALLAAKADVNAKTANGSTALMVASEFGDLFGHLEVVRALLDAKADVNAKTANDVTALILASQQGHLEIVRALLDAKADVNAKADNGGTALILASEFGHLRVVRLLLAANAQVNAKTANGSTALMLASQNGHLRDLIAMLDLEIVRQAGRWRHGIDFGVAAGPTGDSAGAARRQRTSERQDGRWQYGVDVSVAERPFGDSASIAHR